MKLRHALFALVLATGCASLQAREAMATFGESYRGPKTLTVEVAPTAKGDQALIKVYGINHPWNGKVFLASRHNGGNNETEYVIKHEGTDYILMQDGRKHGQRVYLPGQGELELAFDRPASLEVKPEHLMTYFEQQREANK